MKYLDQPMVLLLGMSDIVYPFGRIAKVQNLGLESLAANVDQDLANVKVANLSLLKRDVRGYIINMMEKYQPKVVGLSSMTFQYPTAMKIAGLVKQLNPDAITVLGGYHATLAYQEIAAETDVFDFVVRGEGEVTFNSLLKELWNGSNFDKIPGLSYVKGGKVYHNTPGELLDLSSINLPNRDAEILEGFEGLGLPIALIETSRGCTNTCDFCCISEMYGKKIRNYSIDRVIRDIEDAKSRGAKLIFFVDDNITLNRKGMERLEELCDQIIEHKHNDLMYGFQASVKSIASNEQTVRKLKKAGAKIIFLGIESESQAKLDYHKKNYTSDMTEIAVNNLRKNKIIAWGSYIVGSPDDNEEDLRGVYDSVRRLKLDMVSMALLTPFPGTATRERLHKLGLITNYDDWSKYTLNYVNAKTHHLSPERLERLVWEVQRKWYTSPRMILRNQALHQFPMYSIKFLFNSLLRFFGEKDPNWHAKVPEI